MHRARSFFFVCAGIFLLALAFHLGAMTATAQAPGNPVVAGQGQVAFTSNGDVYVVAGPGEPINPSDFANWTRAGNIFSGPTPATRATWGEVKSRYRPEGTAKPTQDR